MRVIGRRLHRLFGLVFAEANHSVMDVQFTAVFRHVPEEYIGFVEELSGANTQGATLEEARANLHEALAMILAANRELAQEAAGQGPVIRESLKSRPRRRIDTGRHGSMAAQLPLLFRVC